MANHPILISGFFVCLITNEQHGKLNQAVMPLVQRTVINRCLHYKMLRVCLLFVNISCDLEVRDQMTYEDMSITKTRLSRLQL